ncbi:thiamine phosphate synthase [Aquimarina pacifica]|uniref:thiamine phosphate synthase n=1 Tax=Aquimarina pacifica TaxID=1296415 RepID=UPI0004714CB1|nr:thiamine phosphate synthase [Aquimarina pacifica]
MTPLQYISQGKTPEEHLKHIEEVCKAGCRWVQLRLKEYDMATCLNTAIKCRAICDTYDVTMIVNDNIGVAKAAMADGIHLGLEDVHPKEARKIVGDNFIIGGTANTLEDCLLQINNGVDYIGLGPFRYTTTKKKLSPILGNEGYNKILAELRSKHHDVPIVGVGGITSDDISEIFDTGISAIAVSGMLTNQSDIEKTITRINSTYDQKIK